MSAAPTSASNALPWPSWRTACPPPTARCWSCWARPWRRGRCKNGKISSSCNERNKMSQAHEVLERARNARLAGKYEDALRDHLWFHEHALEEDPTLAGVRLSFALRDWIYLAEQFP